MTHAFRPGDRITTVHHLSCYNAQRGVIATVQGDVASIKFDSNPSPEVASFAARNGGLMSYSVGYLRHDDPLSPFEQSVQDYITSELRP